MANNQSSLPEVGSLEALSCLASVWHFSHQKTDAILDLTIPTNITTEAIKTKNLASNPSGNLARLQNKITKQYKKRKKKNQLIATVETTVDFLQKRRNGASYSITLKKYNNIVRTCFINTLLINIGRNS